MRPRGPRRLDMEELELDVEEPGGCTGGAAPETFATCLNTLSVVLLLFKCWPAFRRRSKLKFLEFLMLLPKSPKCWEVPLG